MFKSDALSGSALSNVHHASSTAKVSGGKQVGSLSGRSFSKSCSLPGDRRCGKIFEKKSSDLNRISKSAGKKIVSNRSCSVRVTRTVSVTLNQSLSLKNSEKFQKIIAKIGVAPLPPEHTKTGLVIGNQRLENESSTVKVDSLKRERNDSDETINKNSKKQRKNTSILSGVASNEKINGSPIVELGQQGYETFNLLNATMQIGTYEFDDKEGNSLEKDNNGNLLLFDIDGNSVSRNEERGFVDSSGKKVLEDEKGIPKLYDKNGARISCDNKGNPIPRPPLNPAAQSALHKGCSKSTKNRHEFLLKLQSHLRDIPQAQANADGKNPIINMLDFFGGDKELLALYKAAVAEERNSTEFRDAVFTAACEKQIKGNPCFGKKMVMYVGGPSAAGKSFTRGVFVEKIRERFGEKAPSESKGQDSYVVSVDGGLDREMSQMRQMVLQGALKKGYGGLEDLHKHTNTNVKGFVKKAAMAEGNHMHVVIPATFIEEFQKYPGIFKKLGKNKKIIQVFAEVRADHKGDLSSNQADKSFRKTIRYNGDSRAYVLEGKPDLGKEGIRMNNRSLPCESKVYQPEYFKLGVSFSRKAKKAFKLGASFKRSIILSNESDNMHIKKGEDGKYVQTTTSPDIKHVSRREVDLWEAVKPDNRPSRNVVNQHLEKFGYSGEELRLKTNTLMTTVMKEPEKFADLPTLLNFLDQNSARAKLKVTQSKIS